jgi:acyl-CoA dehydrogenase
MRRAMIESYQFLKYRTTFGTNALNHALIRTKLEELAAIYFANFYLTWRAIKALDAADNGNAQEEQLLRLLTPMTKKSTASTSVYSIRESMELMGGMGYIEDGVIPKIMRDAMVLPIWEGSGNIMTLDMLRALYKSDGFKVMCTEIDNNCKLLSNEYQSVIKDKIEQIQLILNSFNKQEQEIIEATSQEVFEELTIIYQICLLAYYRDEISEQWLNTSIDYLMKTLIKDTLKMKKPLNKQTIEKMIAWDILS